MALKFIRDRHCFEREQTALSITVRGGLYDFVDRSASRESAANRVRTIQSLLPVLHSATRHTSRQFEDDVTRLESELRLRFGDDDRKFRSSDDASSKVDEPPPRRHFRKYLGRHLLIFDAAERNLQVALLMEKFRLDQKVHILRQVLSTLACVHFHGWCHGDVKPANVLRLHSNGNTVWRLIDFDASLQSGSAHTVSTSKFSAAYVPPEFAQLLYGRHRDEIRYGGKSAAMKMSSKFDIWSLGALAFEICSGRPLFRSDGTNNVLADASEVFKLCAWNSLSPRLQKYVARGLSSSRRVRGSRAASSPPPSLDESMSSTPRLFSTASMVELASASRAAQHFIAACLDSDPNRRPEAVELLRHPFLSRSTPIPPAISWTTDLSQTLSRSPSVSKWDDDDLDVPRRPHIFLSYAQKDASGMATTLYFAFKRCGLRVWLDNFESDVTAQGMKNGIQRSDVMVVCLTTHYLTRSWCLKELKWAIKYKKCVLIVRENDDRFSPWVYDEWRQGRMWDRDSKSFQSMSKSLSAFSYESFGKNAELRAVRDLISRAACSCAAGVRRCHRMLMRNELKTALDEGRHNVVFRCSHQHDMIAPSSELSASSTLTYRRKQWAFDAMVDELIWRSGFHVPRTHVLYEIEWSTNDVDRRRFSSSSSSLCRSDAADDDDDVNGGTPVVPVVQIVSEKTRCSDVGRRIAHMMAASLRIESNDEMDVCVLESSDDFTDGIPVIIVLSPGALTSPLVKRAMLSRTNAVTFVYSTQQEHEQSDASEWKFNSPEISRCSSEIKHVLYNHEALPFRWGAQGDDANRHVWYEHKAMIRELFKRLSAVVTTRDRSTPLDL